LTTSENENTSNLTTSDSEKESLQKLIIEKKEKLKGLILDSKSKSEAASNYSDKLLDIKRRQDNYTLKLDRQLQIIEKIDINDPNYVTKAKKKLDQFKNVK